MNIWTKISAFILLSLANLSAQAGNFTVSSVNISMPSRQPTYALTITNESADEPLSMQLDTFAWSQKDGQEVYEASKDILISPRVFNIAPAASQIVRIALRNRQDFPVEQTYRLFVKEIPSEKPLEEGGVRVALQMNIPVHIVPVKIEKKPLEFKYLKLPDGSFALSAYNPGNVYVKAVEVKVIDTATGLPLETAPQVIQVLAGATKIYPLSTASAGTQLGKTLKIQAIGEGLLIDQTVSFDN
ncbi:MAG: fimbria/pilus periplasmic chaperone [Pseudomonadota bacterium]